MDNLHYIAELNDPQREAVTAPLGHHLILAGAGSGKTRVLVHRIAWLIQHEQLDAHHLLAVTFTNKAAKEMLHRIEKLVGPVTSGMWIGTFHSLAHRLLRINWKAANLGENFHIMDSDDQYRLIRRIMKAQGLDEKEWSPKKVQWFINQQKDNGLRAQYVEVGKKIEIQTMVKIYQEYEKVCQENELVDFAELLFRCHELFLNNAELLKHYQKRFQYILIDEFQDTNAIQYAWLRLLIGNQNYFMAVGDDDQSIYAWRGAKIENIHAVNQDYPDTKTIRLEQNYRSTAMILNAANALIAKNERRLGKQLWTAGEEGNPIALYTAYNEIDEACFVVHQIKTLTESKFALKDCAILYRSNAQSRAFEEALLQENIPYRIHGGLRFFERAEIKDALAYLRLILNPQDNAAFERIINLPARGLGEQTLAKIRYQASIQQQSLWQASQSLVEQHALSARAINSLEQFFDLIIKLKEDSKVLGLDSLTTLMLDKAGLLHHYKTNPTEQSQSKVENLEELINATKQFTYQYGTELLREFLAHTALESGETQANHYEDCVELMTIHTAKGLEFPFVAICGLEENLFPHQMSMHSPAQLEEERRLCYVGMTRAMNQLLLTYCEKRRLRGLEHYCMPSRFLAEIPNNYLSYIRPPSQLKQYSSPVHSVIQRKPTSSIAGYSIGQRVKHAVFGEGVILSIDAVANDCRVHVQFSNNVSKWLLASIAKLVAV